jgi:hypothetical protein
MKYKVLPEELQLLQQPLNHWLRPYIEEARIARIEEEELNEGLFVTPDDANAKMISWYHVGKLRRYGNDQDDKERRPPARPSRPSLAPSRSRYTVSGDIENRCPF